MHSLDILASATTDIPFMSLGGNRQPSPSQSTLLISRAILEPLATDQHTADTENLTNDSSVIAGEAGDFSKDILPDDNCFETADQELVLKARQLTAKTYLRWNFVTEDQVGPDGTILPEHDPHSDNSRYFVKTTPDRKKVIATVRVIDFDSEKGSSSFPMLSYEKDLDPESVKEIYDHDMENVKEVSALARDKELDPKGEAALSLYKSIFFSSNFSGNSPETMFIMACNPRLYENFKLLFNGAIKRAGPDLPLPGQDAVPAILPIKQAAKHVIEISKDKKNPYRRVQQLVVDYFLGAMKKKDIDPEVISTLEKNGYDVLLDRLDNNEQGTADNNHGLSAAELSKKLVYAVGVGKVEEKAKKYWPEIVANIGLLGYTAVRTVGVAYGADPVSDTQWPEFLAVELGTQVPYAWGASDLIRGGLKDNYNPIRKTLAATAFGGAFVAPYAYLATHGAMENLQSGATSGVIAAVGLYFLSSKMKSIKAAFKKQQDSK